VLLVFLVIIIKSVTKGLLTNTVLK